MEKEYLEKLTPEVLEFLSQMKKRVNNNTHFMNWLEGEISHILLNKGQISMQNGKLIGQYTYRAGIKKVLGTIRQTITATLENENGQPSFVTECPEDTCTWDNPESINYGRKVKGSYKSETTYVQNDDGTSKIYNRRTNNQSAYMAPRLTLISNRITETVEEYDSDNKDVSYVETVHLKQGYNASCGRFVKFGDDLRDKVTTSVVGMGEYKLVKCVEVTSGIETSRQFIWKSHNVDFPLNQVTNNKHGWAEISYLDYDVLTKDMVSPEEVHTKAFQKKN